MKTQLERDVEREDDGLEMGRAIHRVLREHASWSRRLPAALPTDAENELWRRRPVVVPDNSHEGGGQVLGSMHESSSSSRKDSKSETTSFDEDFIGRVRSLPKKEHTQGRVQAGKKRRREEFRVSKMADLKEYDCSICLAPISRTQVSVLVPCMHRYCYHCIRKWLKISTECPLCKVAACEIYYQIYNQHKWKRRNLSQEWQHQHPRLGIESERGLREPTSAYENRAAVLRGTGAFPRRPTSSSSNHRARPTPAVIFDSLIAAARARTVSYPTESRSLHARSSRERASGHDAAHIESKASDLPSVSQLVHGTKGVCMGRRPVEQEGTGDMTSVGLSDASPLEVLPETSQDDDSSRVLSADAWRRTWTMDVSVSFDGTISATVAESNRIRFLLGLSLLRGVDAWVTKHADRSLAGDQGSGSREKRCFEESIEGQQHGGRIEDNKLVVQVRNDGELSCDVSQWRKVRERWGMQPLRE